MHPGKLAELGIFEGDYVLIRGSQGLKAICIAISSEDGLTPPGDISLNDMVRLNLKKLTSDTVTVAKVAMVAAGIGGVAKANKRAAQANLVHLYRNCRCHKQKHKCPRMMIPLFSSTSLYGLTLPKATALIQAEEPCTRDSLSSVER